MDPRAWCKEGRVRSGEVLSTESEWRKVSLQFSSSLIRRLPNEGAGARNAGMHKSKAGQGGPGKAFIVAYVGPEKSHREFGLELDSVRVSRQCPFNKCSWQNSHGFYTE